MKVLKVAICAFALNCIWAFPMQAQEQDWTGFYAGVTKGIGLAGGDLSLRAGAFGGVNFNLNDAIVIGGELRFTAYHFPGETAVYREIIGAGRMGVLVTDDLLLYKVVGVGQFKLISPETSPSPLFMIWGAGLELAASERFSIRGEAIGYRYFDQPTWFGPSINVSAVLHFN